jgi:Domain of unknown function (DUF4149)
MTLRRVSGAVALLALAVWLGGLLALGALVAPVVFSRVSMPSSADAMTVIFQRFDRVAMSCAAAVLGAEAARVIARVRFAWPDHLRAGVSVLAALAAVYEGTSVSPRIVELHVAGAVRGLGTAGMELATLHDRAEVLGKTEVFLLAVAVVLHAVTVPRTPAPAPTPPSRIG